MEKRFEDLYEVYEYMAATNPYGKSNKQIAMEVWPDKGEKRAKSLLSMCTHEAADEADANKRDFKPKELERFIEACGNPEIFINYLCDCYSIERPNRKLLLTPDKELKIIRQMAAEGIVPTDDNIRKYIEEHKGIISLEAEKPKKSLLRSVSYFEIW